MYRLASQLLDQVVSTDEQRQRHFNPDRLRGLEIDNEFKPGWLLHGQVTRPCALENLGHDQSALSPHVRKNRPIRDEPSGLRMLPPLVNGQEPILRREADDLAMQGRKERRIKNIERFSTPGLCRVERRRKIVAMANF